MLIPAFNLVNKFVSFLKYLVLWFSFVKSLPYLCSVVFWSHAVFCDYRQSSVFWEEP